MIRRPMYEKDKILTMKRWVGFSLIPLDLRNQDQEVDNKKKNMEWI